MSHYEERLAKDLGKIRSRVLGIAERVQDALRNAVTAILTGDQELANATILGDLVVNRRVRKADRMVHRFVARHLPSARHLRFQSSVLRLNVALERIGDYAVVIARELAQLSQAPPEALQKDISMLSDQAQSVLHQAIQAFDESNAELARGTVGLVPPIDRSMRRVYNDLLDEGAAGSRPVHDLFALLTVINRLSRVVDQAENICEETIFVETGETKEESEFNVLFLGQRDDALSQLAVAYARKAFPENAGFSSAGLEPADSLEPRSRLFLERLGLDSEQLQPRTLEDLGPSLAEVDVIVSLRGELGLHQTEDLPFRTVVLAWDVGPPPADFDQDRAEALLEEAFEKLKERIAVLVETLRGKEVD